MEQNFSIINSNAYLQRKILGIIFSCIGILSFPFIGSRYNTYHFNIPSWASFLAFVNFLFFLILGITLFYTKMFYFKGSIVINGEFIKISKNNKIQKFYFQDLDEIHIRTDNLKYKAAKNRSLTNGGGNNYFILKQDNKLFTYEFYIESSEQEQDLFKMIEEVKPKVSVILSKVEIQKWRFYFE